MEREATLPNGKKVNAGEDGFTMETDRVTETAEVALPDYRADC